VTKVPFQVRHGTPPEPEIGESHFRKIEANVRRFRKWQGFTLDQTVREEIREAMRWYCVRTFMNVGGATTADVTRAMKLLIARARELEKTIEQLTGRSNPDNLVISGYLTKHGFADPESLLLTLGDLQRSCERTIAEVLTYVRKGPAPDDALESLIWTLADIFAKHYGVPTTSWSRDARRSSPFLTFAWGVYTSLPRSERKLALDAFCERVHRVRQRWSGKQVKKAPAKGLS
jgi:hypothetical protein